MHWAPQAQTACRAACWQPHAQFEPLQVAQGQGACLTSFMIDFLWFVDDGMSSKRGLWSVALGLDSRLRRAAVRDAATVSPVDRTVKQPCAGSAAKISTLRAANLPAKCGDRTRYTSTQIVFPSLF